MHSNTSALILDFIFFVLSMAISFFSLTPDGTTIWHNYYKHQSCNSWSIRINECGVDLFGCCIHIQPSSRSVGTSSGALWWDIQVMHLQCLSIFCNGFTFVNLSLSYSQVTWYIWMSNHPPSSQKKKRNIYIGKCLLVDILVFCCYQNVPTHLSSLQFYIL